MYTRSKKGFLNLAIACALGVAAVAPIETLAQDTTSAIRGKVLNEHGLSVGDTTVTIEDTRTGVIRSYTSNSSGTFFASKLPVGGPYLVTVSGRDPIVVPSLELGNIFNLTLEPATSGVTEEVLVTGSALVSAATAPGPSATFSLADIDNAVTLSRDIKEVFQIDPRINISNGGSDVNCAGKHPRFNSVTLDGVSYNDRFGLNSNGYSTATGMPFPFDAVEQISVELAPFDVTYGGFSACNINAVTKSGSNEWHGSAFYEFTTNSLRGDEFEDGDETVRVGDRGTERVKGFSIGGPIIKDKLFIFAAYEESEKPSDSALATGYSGSGNGEERDWLSQADYERIVDIANSRYGYDPGGQPSNGAQEDEKYMLRVDWVINDQHDAAFTYNYYDGFRDQASDGDDSEFEFSNHYYVKGAESTTYTMKIASQWTDAFSTEFYYSSNEMIDSQVTVGPKDFADMQISVGDPNLRQTVYLGADDSRQANALNTNSDFIKLSAQWLVADHILTFGFESEKLDIFNQFVQHARGGEYDYFNSAFENPASCDALSAQERLDDPACGISGIDRFELGLPNRIYYGSGGGTNNPADAAASFSNTLNTFYLQDELYLDAQNLTITAGLRYDYFTSSDSPTYNPTFFQQNGIRNNANIDGVDILMPRIGVTWEPLDNLSVRGGLGLYSGGNPNVWISNAWSNDGLTNVQLVESFSQSIFDLDLSGQGRPGYDVPQPMVDTVAGVTATDANNSGLVILDPDYKQPNEWKLAFGGTYDFDNGISVDADLLLSKTQDAAYYVDLSQDVVGETTLGQAIYDTPKLLDENGNQVLDSDGDPIPARGTNNFMLTNSDDTATSLTLSSVIRKSFDMGLDLTFGYAYTDAEDISPMTSSTAESNFTNLALTDINNPRAATSNYETEHRFTFSLSYAKDFFGNLETRFGLFGYRKSGQGTTYVMGSSALEAVGNNGRHLLYVPTGATDPNVFFADNFDTQAFLDWASAEGLGSGFVSRNGAKSRWTTRFDLRIDQELPTFFDGTSARVFLKVSNLGNLLNKKWGRQTERQFFNQEVVEVSINDDGQYVYESFTPGNAQDVRDIDSVWEGRLGLQFNF